MRSGALQGPGTAGACALQRAGSSLGSHPLHRPRALRRAALRTARLRAASLRARTLRRATRRGATLLLTTRLLATLLLTAWLLPLLRAIALLRAVRLIGLCLSHLRPRLRRRCRRGRRQ